MKPSQLLALVGAAIAAVCVALLLPSIVALADSETDRTLRDDRITESSGLVVSTKHPGVLYTHNDSIDGPRVFAVGEDGGTDAELVLAGAESRDWEGMAAGPRGTLWVADIGDNIDGWGTYRVYRFKEPSTLTDREVEWTQYDFRYDDGKSHNAETLMVHPKTGRLYVATKQLMGAALYVAPERLSTDGPNTLTRVSKTLQFATDGAFSPDGELFVVRGYVDAKVYRTDEPGKAIATVDLPAQPQGETIAWSPDGRFLYAGSEGSNSKVWRVPLPSKVTAISAPASATSLSPAASAATGDVPSLDEGEVGPTAPAADDGGLNREQLIWLALGALVLIALGFSLRAWAKHDPDKP